jgi:hypothetical protein
MNGLAIQTTSQSNQEGQLLTLNVSSAWISLSSSVILYNKWILHTLKFRKGSPTTYDPVHIG